MHCNITIISMIDLLIASLVYIFSFLFPFTVASQVPRVFINQKFVGGGSEITAMDKSGELKKLLS